MSEKPTLTPAQRVAVLRRIVSLCQSAEKVGTEVIDYGVALRSACEDEGVGIGDNFLSFREMMDATDAESVATISNIACAMLTFAEELGVK